MKVKSLIITGFAALMLASCSTPKTVLPYFTDITEVKEGTMPAGDYMPTIEPDDELFITVTSREPKASAEFNIPSINPAFQEKQVISTQARQQTYVVNSEGDINFPTLGKLHVAGLTIEQLQKQLTEAISKDVIDPLVYVQLVNFEVVVAGEVVQPGRFKVTRNRLSVLDALSLAGDLTPYGERSNVLLVREENGERKFVHLNLNSSDLLKSPYFYVKQNDYIYVEPNEVRQDNAKYNQDKAYKLSLTSTIVSATSVIASLAIAVLANKN